MKTYTYSYQNGPCLGASADAGEFGRVPEGPPAGRVGAYRIRPPNIPQGMNDHTRGRVFATDGGARWGVCCCASYTGTRTNKPTGRSPQQTNIKRATGPNGWTPDMIIRPVPGRLVGRMQYAPTLPAGGPSGTRPNSPASADALTPRKVSNRAAERFRRVGKLQNAPLNVSDAWERG